MTNLLLTLKEQLKVVIVENLRQIRLLTIIKSDGGIFDLFWGFENTVLNCLNVNKYYS